MYSSPGGMYNSPQGPGFKNETIVVTPNHLIKTSKRLWLLAHIGSTFLIADRVKNNTCASQ